MENLAHGDKPPVVNRRLTDTQVTPAIDWESKFFLYGSAVVRAADKDGSGTVTREELGGLLQNPLVRGKAAQAAVALYENFRNVAGLDADGLAISFDDIKLLQKTIDRYKTSRREEPDSLDVVALDIYSSANHVYHANKKQENCNDLYDRLDSPLESIGHDAITQGKIGDCYFLASLASVAHQHPELIANSIKQNKDGRYTVTFAGDRENPITVSAPSQAELALYNKASKNGTWASVMEKAYGIYCQNHLWKRLVTNPLGGNTPQEAADNGGKPSKVIELLTGKETDTVLVSDNKEKMAARLGEAFQEGRHKAVAAAIHPFSLGKTEDGYQTWHVYSVLDFTPDKKGGGTVTLKNPWNSQYAKHGGLEKVSLATFMRNFSSLAIEK